MGVGVGVGVDVGVGLGVGVGVEVGVGVGVGVGQSCRKGLQPGFKGGGAANTPDPRSSAETTPVETKPKRAYAREREVAMTFPQGRPLCARPAHVVAPTSSDNSPIDAPRSETNGHSGWFSYGLFAGAAQLESP